MRERMIWGRYIETNSWMHRLDPRSKCFAMIIYLLIVISIRTFTGALAVILLSAMILYSTKISYSYYYRAVRPLRFLIGFIVVFSVLFTGKGEALLAIGTYSIYKEGVVRGVLAGLRIILFVAFSATLTFTTSPAKLMMAIADVLFPLKWLRLSPQKIGLMLSIALRFVPTLFEEAGKILKAQASRGADIKELPWRGKAKVLVSLLVPVTVGAVRRAGDLVDSMQSRGFQLGAPRSKLHLLIWQRQDTLFLLGLIGFLIGLLWLQTAVRI